MIGLDGGWFLAGFPNAEARDSNGFSPLHHALDACVYAVRAGKAAEQLIAHTPLEIINAQTTCHQPCWPNGYTCLHFACDGSDKYYLRRRLTAKLLDKKADLEIKTANKDNTRRSAF